MKRPLLRFAVLGLLLFLTDGFWSMGAGGAAGLAPLVPPVSDDAVWFHEALARGYHRTDAIVRRRLARNMRFASSDEDRTDAELVDDAIALGMHESDLVVRRRLVQKMKLLVHDRVRRTEPTEAELAAYLEANAARFTEPERVRVTQVYFRDEARARAAASRLRGPDELDHVGDPLPIPRHLPPHSQAELARQLGPAFAAAVFAAADGHWVGPFASAYGAHWVWIHERRPATRSALETVRSEVRESLLYERSQAAVAREIARLREKYGVPREAGR